MANVRNRTVNFEYREGSWDDPCSREESQRTEDTAPDGEYTPNENYGALLSFLRSVGTCHLLTPEEERVLAKEIEACREKLIVLCMELSSTLRDTEGLTMSIRKEKRKEMEGRGNLIEKMLGKLKAIDRSVTDPRAKSLLEQIHQVEVQLRCVSERMVRANQRLVIRIARLHMNRGLPLLDLIQEGNLGLMKAVVRFDPGRGYKFGTYAWWWIWQAMDKAVKNNSRLIRLPLSIYELRSRYRRAIASLSGEARDPSPSEIMERAALSSQQFTSLRELVKETVSLDKAVGSGERRLGELIPSQGSESPIEVASLKELSDKVRGVLKVLTPREEEVITKRFGINHERDHTLEEIGAILSITKEGVRQIEKRALEKLKTVRCKSQLREFWAIEK